jgi:hypothetical protein
VGDVDARRGDAIIAACGRAAGFRFRGRPAESAAAAEADDEDSKDRSCRSKGKGERKGQERNTEHLIHRRAPDHRYRSPVTKLEGGRT